MRALDRAQLFRDTSSMSMKSMTMRPDEVAQAELAGDLVGGLEVGLGRPSLRCSGSLAWRGPEFTSMATSASVGLMTM